MSKTDPAAATAANRREITECLLAHSRGEKDAFDRLVDLVYADLRRIARQQLARGRPGETLDTTSLVNEAYLKLVDQNVAGWQGRSHFFAVSARAMRHILVDHARRHSRLKRGGSRSPLQLDEDRLGVSSEAETLLTINDALTKLRRQDDRLVRVVECRFFGGMSERETAEALEVSHRTVQRDWLKAKAWLRQEMEVGNSAAAE